MVEKHLLCFPVAPIFSFFLTTTSLQCSTISFPPCRASVRKSHQISHSLRIFSTSLSEHPFLNLCNSSSISSVYSSDNFSEFKKDRLSCLEKRSDALEYFLKMQEEKEKSSSLTNCCSHIGREWAVSGYGLLLISTTQIYCFTYQF